MVMVAKKIQFLSVLTDAYKEFRKNDPLRMAGATSFFATFALPAILIILIQIFGVFVSPRYMTSQLMDNLGEMFGVNTARELHRTLHNVRHLATTWWIAGGGFLFLIFVATTLFKVIKDSLNQLWNIKVEDHAGIVFNLLNRAKSFVAILLAGVLFMGVLLAEFLTDFSNQTFLGAHYFSISNLIRNMVAMLVVSLWFAVLFKYLPDGRPKWKIALGGGLLTGVMLILGKLLLQWLLTYSNMQTIYGASTSSVLLLLFVFYCSFIFYYGACFTKALSDHLHQPIEAGRHAVKYKLSEIKQGKAG